MRKVDLFRDAPTTLLVKAAGVYKLCQSDFFIRNCDRLMDLSMGVLGTEATRTLIEKTAGEFFITGTSIEELTEQSEKSYKKHKLGSIADYSLEGLVEYDEQVLEQSKDFMIDILRRYCQGRPYCDLAVKFTGFTTLDVCKELNDIQFVLFRWFETLAGNTHASHRKFEDQITKEAILAYF